MIAALTHEDLRACANLAGNTRGADRWTALDWLKLYAAYKACGWDITPDNWTWWQVEDAIERGVAPRWGEHERDPLGEPGED